MGDGLDQQVTERDLGEGGKKRKEQSDLDVFDARKLHHNNPN